MSINSTKTIDIVSEIFGTATVEVLTSGTGAQIKFAPTIQKIPSVHLKPDIGCFVQFHGSYSGLLIINFSKEAALAYYKKSMLFMGMPENELSTDHNAEDVVDSIGEVSNQIIGKARQKIQTQYGLSAFNNQPKAICLVESIMLSIENLDMKEDQCRRLSFTIDQGPVFYIELYFEQTEFIVLGNNNKSTVASNANVEKLLKK